MENIIPLPRIVILPLLYRCNSRCVMCNIWKKEGGAQWKPVELERIFSNDLFSQNVEVVNITGGEPSLHEDFLIIFELVLNKLSHLDTISLQTNGLDVERVLTVVQFVIQLLLDQESKGRSIHLDINISLDGPEKTHDKIRGVKGAWKAAVKTARESTKLIKQLRRGSVSFNFTIVRQNIADIIEMLDIAGELGIEITYTFPQETDMFMENNKTTGDFTIDHCQKLELISKLKELNHRTNGRSAISKRYLSILVNILEGRERKSPCPLAKNGVFLEPGGNVYPCWNASRHLLGNIFEQELETILVHRADQEYKIQLNESCRTCTSNCYIEWNRKRFAKLSSGLSK
jgi:radical SAM protein with 4Fe4S-binding SPASM domain